MVYWKVKGTWGSPPFKRTREHPVLERGFFNAENSFCAYNSSLPLPAPCVLRRREGDTLIFRNHLGEECPYPELPQ